MKKFIIEISIEMPNECSLEDAELWGASVVDVTKKIAGAFTNEHPYRPQFVRAVKVKPE